jgi:selenocysteine lyase/cysteine desulfurase
MKCQKELFEVPDGVTYLNAAYMGPLLKTSAAIGEKAMRKKLTPWALPISDFFDPPNRFYQLAADLIDARPSDVAIIPSVSYGTAIAAKNIKVNAGQNIVVMADQFPSNVYCWRTLAEEKGANIVTVPWPENGDWTTAILDSIDEDTALVATANAHWTNGSYIDLVTVGKKVSSVNAALVLDLTQSLGVTPFSVKDVDPDYMVVGAYKWLLGPYSIGFLYAAPRNQNGHPIEESWLSRKGAEDFTRLVDYQEDYEEGARRYDMGEKSNFINVAIAIDAFEFFQKHGVDAISSYIKSLTDYIAAEARKIGLSVEEDKHRVPNLIGINFKEGVPKNVPEALAQKNVYVSIRGDSIRIAPHVYNDIADVDRFFEVLKEALQKWL